MPLGSQSVYSNNSAAGMLAGAGLVVSSVSAAVLDRPPARWLALVQLFAGMVLAAGLLFARG